MGKKMCSWQAQVTTTGALEQKIKKSMRDTFQPVHRSPDPRLFLCKRTASCGRSRETRTHAAHIGTLHPAHQHSPNQPRSACDACSGGGVTQGRKSRSMLQPSPFSWDQEQAALRSQLPVDVVDTQTRAHAPQSGHHLGSALDGVHLVSQQVGLCKSKAANTC